MHSRVPLAGLDSNSCSASVVWYKSYSGSICKTRCGSHFDHLPEPLAVDHQDISPICSHIQDLQTAFPATILTYGLTLMNWSICSFPVSRHGLLRLSQTLKFSEEKKPNVKRVVLGHYLEALNNLEPNNILTSLEYISFSFFSHQTFTTLCEKQVGLLI